MWSLATTRDEGSVGFVIVDDVVLLSPFVGMRHTKMISPQGCHESGQGRLVGDGSGPCSVGERRLRTVSMSEFGIETCPEE